MITQHISKLFFIDVETVGISSSLSVLETEHPRLFKVFTSSIDWFNKRFPETINMTNSEIYLNRAALVPEFGRIVCVSMGFITPSGELKKLSFYGPDEEDILKKVNESFNKVIKLDYHICGHNIKNFDIPYIIKRMIINNILPSKLLPSYDTKPWEIKAVDTMEIWKQNGTGLCSLELICSSLDIPSSKDGEVTGNVVHENFYEKNNYTEIMEYCERDVDNVVEIIKKLKELN